MIGINMHDFGKFYVEEITKCNELIIIHICKLHIVVIIIFLKNLHVLIFILDISNFKLKFQLLYSVLEINVVIIIIIINLR